MTTVLLTSDADAWTRAVPASRTVFGSLGFARVQESFGATCRLLVAAAGGVEVAYPVLLLGVPGTGNGTDGQVDVATPPFTGPLPRGSQSQPDLAEAGRLLREGVEKLGAVTEFAHIHPWRDGVSVLAGADVVQRREIVYIDLERADGFETGYSRACQKNVRRALEAGVVIRECETDADLVAFHRVYVETMERRGAAQRYRFPLEFFATIRAELPENSRFVIATVDGTVIAGTLYLADRTDVYSYLGGADMAYQSLRPTNLVVHETAVWARSSGRRRVVLGGGYRPGDGIERFKAGFSPCRSPLPELRRVHDRDTFDRLIASSQGASGVVTGADFFPAYRQAARHDPQ